MKHILVLTLFVTAISCSNNKNNHQQSLPVTENPASTDQYTSPPADTGTYRPPEKVEHTSVFPIGKYKSLSDIMEHVISQGSTKKEVLNVQGQPDYTETDGVYENWYYGKGVVQFKGMLVSGVSDPDSKLNYAEYLALALSPDKIEAEFYILLNERRNR